MKWITLLLVCTASVAQTEDYQLELGGARFDPLQGVPALGPDWQMPDRSEADLQLVQYRGPIEAQWLETLAEAELEIVQYIHPYTYIVWGSRQALARHATQNLVRWTGPFQVGYRVLPRYRSTSQETVSVGLLVYRGADIEGLLAELRQIGYLQGKPQNLDNRFMTIKIQLAPAHFARAARIAGVYTLQVWPTDGGSRGEMASQVNAQQVEAGMAVPGYEIWLASRGLSGDGVVLASVDSGIDQTHLDLANRMLPCVGETCDEHLSSSHGTHVAGIVAGDGSSGSVGPQGFLRGLGVAPGAQLIEQNYLGVYLTPGGMRQLIAESSRNQAQISSNSWGPSGTALGYDIATLEVDLGVRDADPVRAGNQPFSYVLAIDNGSGGVSTQGTPDEAKNIISVGSTWLRQIDGPQQDNINSISDNSAHGPALDGRLLPDLVAPGKYVESTTQGGNYQYLAGTSMAAPQVAGGVALFHEYYRGLPHNPGGIDPTPAMVKAALMAVARNLEGGTDADGNLLGHRFDNQQGWGRLNLEAVLDPGYPVAYLDNPEQLQKTGDQWSITATVATEGNPVQIMLVYTDAPGHGLGGSLAAWNNDLNLEVDYAGRTLLGNVLGDEGWSEPGGSADQANNVEAVLLAPTMATIPITIRVQGHNLNSDGVPGSGSTTDQDFAVVCYNCDLSADFLITADAPQQSVCLGEASTYQIHLGRMGSFTSPVALTVTGLPAGTTANFSQNPVTPPATSTLTLTGTQTAGDIALLVAASGGGRNHELSLMQHVEAEPPQPVSLSVPLDATHGQSLAPLFRWQTQSGVDHYFFELALDSAFTDLVQSQTLAEPELLYTDSLNYETTYYWRVSADNPCGEGAWSTAYTFETVPAPPLLLVDEDDNLPNVLSAYTNALSFWGISYDLWDVSLELGEPPASLMSQYRTVFWFTGNNSRRGVGPPQAGPSAAGEIELATYLDGGGSLILSSMYYLTDLGGNPFVPTEFMTQYLGIASATPNVGLEELYGVGADFNHLGPYTLSMPYTNRSDAVSPTAGAELIFRGNHGDAGILHDTGTYKTTFMGWPFDGLSEERLEVLLALANSSGIVLDICRNFDNFNAKLPFWPTEQTVSSLVECLNLFLVE